MLNNFTLIDWRNLFFSALWIIGLAVILSAFGFADYQAREKTLRMRRVLQLPEYTEWINAGFMLFCLGLLGLSRHWWEVVAWIGLAIWFCIKMIFALRAHQPE